MKNNLKEILGSESLYNEYIISLINRLSTTSMSEKHNQENTSARFKDNMKAFKILLNNGNKDITEELLIEIANTVNESSFYIANGYRTIGEFITDTNIKITPPELISQEIKKLLAKYKNEWQSLDPLEREARLHIELINIHPFEDGNGRTSQLLLNYNLLKQGLPPIVITNDLRPFYQEYLTNNDIENMTKLFKNQATKELEIINNLSTNQNSQRKR